MSESTYKPDVLYKPQSWGAMCLTGLTSLMVAVPILASAPVSLPVAAGLVVVSTAVQMYVGYKGSQLASALEDVDGEVSGAKEWMKTQIGGQAVLNFTGRDRANETKLMMDSVAEAPRAPVAEYSSESSLGGLQSQKFQQQSHEKDRFRAH